MTSAASKLAAASSLSKDAVLVTNWLLGNSLDWSFSSRICLRRRFDIAENQLPRKLLYLEVQRAILEIS